MEGLPERLAVGAREVHVFTASLELPAAEVSALERSLAANERARAAAFRFERDRSRYIVGRGLLRALLGRYLGLAPELVAFEYGPFAKPRLSGRGPWFNLSHSGPVAMYAFSGAGEVGIDVELEGTDYARERIAERFFSPGEVAVLRSLPRADQAHAFLRCWTRKEAFIKARGDGLSLPLDSFDVSLRRDEQAALLRTAWSGAEPGQWRLQDLSDHGAGLVAALASRGEDRPVLERHTIGTIPGTMPEQEDR